MSNPREAMTHTVSLTKCLADITAASPRHDYTNLAKLREGRDGRETVIWLESLPPTVELVTEDESPGSGRLAVSPVRRVPIPNPPEALTGWLTEPTWTGDGPLPELTPEPLGLASPTVPTERGATGSDEAVSDEWEEETSTTDASDEDKARKSPQRAAIPLTVASAYSRWKLECERWESNHGAERAHRALYDTLDMVRRTLERDEDQFELVFTVGLVRWQEGGGICRHLVSEPASLTVDHDTGALVTAWSGSGRKLEADRVFAAVPNFQMERMRQQSSPVLEAGSDLWVGQAAATLQSAAEFALSAPVDVEVSLPTQGVAPEGVALPRTPTVSTAPALILRRKSQRLLQEAYQSILAALEGGTETDVPVALAELVVDLDQTVKESLVKTQGVATGQALAEDPLFPLPTNDEQRLILQRIRHDNSVVVQGPPGTGKTHTIANLCSALLAQGQRVLITSEKDQALRVLREKIPADIRDLCVLLTGGSRDAAQELQRSLRSLSEVLSSPDKARLPQKIHHLRAERAGLLSDIARIDDLVVRLRELETSPLPPLVPGFSQQIYCGLAGDIAATLTREHDQYSWLPDLVSDSPDQPPLSTDQLFELLNLARQATASGLVANGQLSEVGTVPADNEVMTPARFAELVAAEQGFASSEVAHSKLGKTVLAMNAEQMQWLLQMVDYLSLQLEELGLLHGAATQTTTQWTAVALSDHLCGHKAGVWEQVHAGQGKASEALAALTKIQYDELEVELTASVAKLGVGTARRYMQLGHELLKEARDGKPLRKSTPWGNGAYNAAQPFLNLVHVNGQPPATKDELSVAIERLRVELMVTPLVSAWAEAGVNVSVGSPVTTLSDLNRMDAHLARIRDLALACHNVSTYFRQIGHAVRFTDAATLARFVTEAADATRQQAGQASANALAEYTAHVETLCGRENICTEVPSLRSAVVARDTAAYQDATTRMLTARTNEQLAQRLGELQGAIDTLCPGFTAIVLADPTNTVWEHRLTQIPQAWAHQRAWRAFEQLRSPGEEQRLVQESLDKAERWKQVTAQLAGAQALEACLARMTDSQAKALRSYAEHMRKIGAGKGSKVKEFRKAAAAAMDDARGAVPAWVVPLPQLLENLPMERNSFDVVVVDEASQIGMEHLYLLWLAPRIIVVGDDQQCTPGLSRPIASLAESFDKVEDHLRKLPRHVSRHFTPKTHLYGLLSARAGKDSLVRLREHYRCVPEIINWSSAMFYATGESGGLIPLREREVGSLEPLVLHEVPDGYNEGKDTNVRNEPEADRMMAVLQECLADPRYDGKTFGIVVLQGSGQIKLLEHRLAEIPAEVRAKRRIRVSNAAGFQGDERDVMFLSMVVATRTADTAPGAPPRIPRVKSTDADRQAFNVAASRARDQMHVFTSVHPSDYRTGDLRADLTQYVANPPSVFGESPDLADVPEDTQVPPFDSRLEQRVFRRIKERGYHVVPQFAVGQRRLDLVVSDGMIRVAVECDGHTWHMSPEAIRNDALRDRELKRMGWVVHRVRESEFELNPDRELQRLWEFLDEAGIHPVNDDKDAPATASPEPYRFDAPGDIPTPRNRDTSAAEQAEAEVSSSDPTW